MFTRSAKLVAPRKMKSEEYNNFLYIQDKFVQAVRVWGGPNRPSPKSVIIYINMENRFFKINFDIGV